MRKSTDTLSRHWAMLQRIPAHPRWISTAELNQYLANEAYEIDIRSTQRDLNHLSTRFPLYCEKDGRVNHWQWAKGAHALEVPSMAPTAAFAFNLVEQYLRPLLPGSTLKLMQPYFVRASGVMKNTKFQGWRKNVRIINRGPHLQTPPINNKVRDVVYMALMERRKFEVGYTPRQKNKAVTYEVNPHGLVIKEGITYLVSTLWDYDDLKHLALHRMSKPKDLHEPAKIIKGFDLNTYIENQSSFAYPVSKGSLKLKVQFSNSAAFHLQESRLSEDQKLTPVGKDKTLLSATVPDSSEIRWWLLGFGDQVEVLGPKALRDEFAGIANNLKGFYL
ncbi:MAG: WYL domain-containing protein [Proteobacteria bacterium]|nr:WYL domain-containing protein [Pseudomonadota bacterium]